MARLCRKAWLWRGTTSSSLTPVAVHDERDEDVDGGNLHSLSHYRAQLARLSLRRLRFQSINQSKTEIRIQTFEIRNPNSRNPEDTFYAHQHRAYKHARIATRCHSFFLAVLMEDAFSSPEDMSNLQGQINDRYTLRILMMEVMPSSS